MPSTLTKTYSYTFTRIEMVVQQYRIALGFTKMLNKKEMGALLKAIEDKKISMIGIYTKNKNRERTEQMTIGVDWDKHKRIIQTSGEFFPAGQEGFIDEEGMAAETGTVLQFVQKARDLGLDLSMWVLLAKTITGKEREDLLKEIGFTGGKPAPWSGKITAEFDDHFKTLPEMSLGYKTTATE